MLGIDKSFLIGDTKVISLDEVFPGDWLCDQSLNDPCSLHCSGFVSGVSGLWETAVWLVMLIPPLGAPPPKCHGVMVSWLTSHCFLSSSLLSDRQEVLLLLRCQTIILQFHSMSLCYRPKSLWVQEFGCSHRLLQDIWGVSENQLIKCFSCCVKATASFYDTVQTSLQKTA